MLSSDISLVVTFIVFVGAFGTVVLIAWPFLQRGRMTSRLKSVTQHRQDLSDRQMTALQQPQRTARARQKRHVEIMKSLLDRLNLKEKLQAKELRAQLYRAGFRSQTAPVIYISSSLIGPVALPAAVYAYLSVIMPALATGRLLLALVGAAAFGFFTPRLYVSNAAANRKKAMTRAFPDALDLLVICVEAGLSLEGAVARVTEEMAASAREMAEEIGLLGAELAFLGDRRQAYENFADRTGLESAKSLSTTLIQAERYGTSIAVGLRVLSQENRDSRLAAAEKKAGALPAQLTVPMILFFLPVLFIVIVVPAAIQIMNR